MRSKPILSITRLTCAVGLLAAASAAPADDMTLERGHFAGGVIKSTSGPFELSGSVGEWGASARDGLSDGTFAVTGGFWARSSRDSGSEWPGLTGGWYDPDTEGQGFNLQVFPGGLLGYFYGYDGGERLWLATDVYTGSFEWDEAIEIPVFAGAQGTFGDPVAPPDGIEAWGTVELTFHSCASASATLSGASGTETMDLVQLAGVDGFENDCTASPQQSDLADLSGAWFDPATDGQGWNLIATPFGLLAYFYGYTDSGEPLWLVSENLPQSVLKDSPVTIDLLSRSGGDFGDPIHPTELEPWGQADITFHDCESASVEIDGEDGTQTQSIVRLLGIANVEECQIGL